MDNQSTERTKILIVDDLPVDQRLVGNILRRHGFALLTASTGSEGITLARDEQPDTILLSTETRDIDGFEVLRRLKRLDETREIPVILISATYRDDDRVALGLDQGAHDYVTKPVDPAVLVARVRAAVRLRRAEQSLRDAEARLATAGQLQAAIERVRSIAHELAQPLAITSGIVELMLAVDGLDDVTRSRLAEVQAGNERMAEIFDRLRSITSCQPRDTFPGVTGVDLNASASGRAALLTAPVC